LIKEGVESGSYFFLKTQNGAKCRARERRTAELVFPSPATSNHS